MATAKGHALTKDDRLYGEIIEALMCYGRADLNAIGAAHGVAPEWAEEALRDAQVFLPDGLTHCNDGQMSLADGAEIFVRLVASAFDQHMHRSNARHSVAV